MRVSSTRHSREGGNPVALDLCLELHMNEEREKLKRRHGSLFDAVTKALFEDDPVGINFGDNTDEYDPEAGTIIPRLSSARSEDDVQTIVFEEFCRWFDAETAGDRSRYQSVSLHIWRIWRDSKTGQ